MACIQRGEQNLDPAVGAQGRPPLSAEAKKAKKTKARKADDDDDDDIEILTPMPADNSSLHDGMYATNGSSEDQNKARKQQQGQADKAKAKAQRKEAKKAEKA